MKRLSAEGTARRPPDEDDPGGPPPPAGRDLLQTPTSPSRPRSNQCPTRPRQTRKRRSELPGRENRSNATHASVTDPDARLYKERAPGAQRRCCAYMGHTLMERPQRPGCAGGPDPTLMATASAKAAIEMINRPLPRLDPRRLTSGRTREVRQCRLRRRSQGAWS